jgi:hypothetical protein
MNRGILALTKGLIVLTAVAVLLGSPAAGQTLPTSPPAARAAAAAPDVHVARTAWGHPDLQGVWTTDAEVSVPLERPREFGERTVLTEAELSARHELEKKLARDDPADRDPRRYGPVGDGPVDWFEWGKQPSARTSLIVDPPDGRMPPWTPAAQARTVEGRRVVGYGGDRAGSTGGGPFDGPEDLSLADRCVTRGLPTTWFPQVYNNGFQIVQSADSVAILYERLHEARVIPLNGQPQLNPAIRQWLGDSRGHFEGETLVVEVTNFGNQTSFRRSGDTLHLVERYTRVDAETLRVAITIDDPATWTRPWTVVVTGKRDPAYSVIFEYACHEGNYSLANILKAARAEEHEADRSDSRK